MAELPDVFNSDEHEPMNQMLPIDDTYIGEIVKSEIKNTKSGNGGKRLNMQVKVIESKESGDKYAGRLVFIGLNIANPNSQAVEISQRELKSICDATGVESLEDSEELHGIAFGFKLKIEKGSDGYDDKVVIKKYMTEGEYKE